MKVKRKQLFEAATGKRQHFQLMMAIPKVKNFSPSIFHDLAFFHFFHFRQAEGKTHKTTRVEDLVRFDGVMMNMTMLM